MSRKHRSEVGGFGLAFLDVICCGFGAIVLLLVLTKIGEPAAIEQSRADLDGMIRKLQDEIYEIRGETNIFNRQLVSKQEQLSVENDRIARLRGDLSRIQGEFSASAQDSEVSDILEGRMVAAQQVVSDLIFIFLTAIPQSKIAKEFLS